MAPYYSSVLLPALLLGLASCVRGSIPSLDSSSVTPQSYGSDFVCNSTTNNDCAGHIWQCDDSTDCNLECSGDSVCDSAYFICPSNATCTIECNNYYSCRFLRIDASMSDELHITAQGFNAFHWPTIICPDDGLCNITARGDYTLLAAQINAINSAELMVYGSDGRYPLHRSSIYCPLVSSSNDPQSTACSVIGSGEYPLYDVNIFHPDSLDAVYVSCTGTCFRQDNIPQIFCNDNYDTACSMMMVESPDLVICDDADSECFSPPYTIDTVGSTFNCSLAPYYCFGQILRCQDATDCNVFCGEHSSCSQSIIQCPSGGDYQCNVYCTDSATACQSMMINDSDYGTLTVTAINTDSDVSIDMLKGSDIHCPNYGECNVNSHIVWSGIDSSLTTDLDIYGGTQGSLNVNCLEQRSCLGVDIYLNTQTDLLLSCNAVYSCLELDVYYETPENDGMDAKIEVSAAGDYALQNARIRCPDTSNPDSSCFVHAEGDYLQMIKGLQIWTIGSFDDVDLVCNYSRSYEMNCAPRDGGEGYMPLMGCNGFGLLADSEPTHSCYFQLMKNTDDWECKDVSSNCALTARTEYEEATSITSSNNRFICTQYRECAGRKYQCLDDMDCFFSCIGEESCAYATFICPSTANECEVYIIDSRAYNLTVDASQSDGGTLIVQNTYSGNDDYFQSFMYGEILCPNNGDCNVTCSGNRACHSLTAVSQEWSQLFVIGDGGEQVLDSMNIYCPTNTVTGFNDDCYVIAKADGSQYALNAVTIYALEGIHDVYIGCQDANDFYTECIDGDRTAYDEYPWLEMYCGTEYQYQCDMDMLENTIDEPYCLNTSSRCMETQVFPTTTTTISTTTSTITATKPATTTTTGKSGGVATEQHIDDVTQSTDTIIQRPLKSDRGLFVLYIILATSVAVVVCLLFGICAKMFCYRRSREQTNREEIGAKIAEIMDNSHHVPAPTESNEMDEVPQEDEKEIELVAMESNNMGMEPGGEEEEEGVQERGDSEEIYVDAHMLSVEGALRREQTEDLYRQPSEIEADKPTATGTTTGAETCSAET